MDFFNNENGELNPFDNLARLHNEGLDYVLKRLTEDKKYRDKEVTIEIIVQLVSEYIVSIQPDASRIDEAAVFELTANILNQLNKKPFSEILNNGNVSEKAKSFIWQIMEINEAEDVEYIFEKLLSIEQEIQKSDMSALDKQYPLLCIAFAKKSINYGQDQEKMSLWQRFKRRLRNSKWSWKADAKGSVGGAISGALKGAILGGGVLITTVVGAVAGAIGNSVQDYLFSPDKK